MHKSTEDPQLPLKPAAVVKRYREIVGLHSDLPLPRDVTYRQMLAFVQQHDYPELVELPRTLQRRSG